MPKITLEWRINVVTLATLLVSMATGGTMVYAQVLSTQDTVEKLESRVTAQFQAGAARDLRTNGLDGRTIALETKMDFIIEQNKEIIARLNSGR